MDKFYREALKDVDGLFVGQLDADELELFYAAISAGVAYHDFNHSGGILGLAKVGIRRK